MIGWLIALGIILLLLLILLIPLTFQLDWDDAQTRRFWQLSWAFVTLFSSEENGVCQKNQMETERDKQKKSKKPKKSKKKTEKSLESSDEEKGKKAKQLLDALASLPKPLRRLWKGFSIRGLVIGIEVGRFDAKACAVAYGAVNAAVYNGLAVLQQSMRVRLEQVTVRCAFGKEENRYVFRGTVHFCLLSAIVAACSFLFRFLWKQVRRMMSLSE